MKKNWLLDGYQKNIGAVVFGAGVVMHYLGVGGAAEAMVGGVTVLMGGSLDSIWKTFKQRKIG